MNKKNIVLVISIISIISIVYVSFTKLNEKKSKTIPEDVTYLVTNSYMDAFNLSEKERMNMYLVGLDQKGNEVWDEKYKTNASDANQFYNDVDGMLQLMTRSGKLEISKDSRNVEWLADLGTDGNGNYIDVNTGNGTWTNKAGGYFEESGYIQSQDIYYQVINSGLTSEEIKQQAVAIDTYIPLDGYSVRLYEDDDIGNEYPVCFEAQSFTYDEETNNLYFICPIPENEKIAISYINLDKPKVEKYTMISEGDFSDKVDNTNELIAGYITENKTFYIEKDGYVKVFEKSLFKEPDLKKNKVTKYQISNQPFKKIMSINSNFSDEIFAFATINKDKSISVHYLNKNTYDDKIIDLDYVISDENQNTQRINSPYLYIGDNYYIVTEPVEVGGGVNEYKITEFDSEGNITNSFTHDFEYTEVSSVIKL